MLTETAGKPWAVGLRVRLCQALPHLPVAVLIGAYILRFSLLSVDVHDGFGTPGFDMGIFDQGVWLLSRFHSPFVTVMGRNLFGDHTSFVLLLAVPLYWVWPHPQTLLVLQSVLLGLAAVPVYVLGRKWSGTTLMATGLAGAYLLNPALQNGNLEQFHPEAFLVLTVAVAIYAAVEWRVPMLVAAVALCLLVKEDTALLTVPLGVWVFFRRNRRWGIAIVGTSVVWELFATNVVIRLLLGTSSFYASRIPFGGIGGLIREPFVHPAGFWRYLRSGYRPSYLWEMGASFGWAFLIAPEIAAIGVLTLAENTLSRFSYMQQIRYHYSLPLVPIFALGTALAVGRLRATWLRGAAVALVVLSAFWACYLWGLAPFSLDSYPHLNPSSPRVAAINRVLHEVPPSAVISAWYPLVAHLDHRVRIYQWPTPFRATVWGLYKQEGQRLPFAGEVQYLVIPDPQDLSESDKPVFASISSQFQLVDSGGGVALYRRVGPSGSAPTGLGGPAPVRSTDRR